MGESLGWFALIVVLVTGMGALLTRMAKQLIDNAEHNRKVTECVASLNMLMVHMTLYSACSQRSAEQRERINTMRERWNARYSRWRGYEEIPALI